MFSLLSGQIRVGGMGEFVGYDMGALEMILIAKAIPQSEWCVYVEQIANIGEVAKKHFRSE